MTGRAKPTSTAGLTGLLVTFLWMVVTAPAAHSWGAKGHRTVAQIAENHLSDTARTAVRDLTGAKTLAMLAAWPDSLYSESAWGFASPWHYVSIDEDKKLEDIMKNAETSLDPDNLIEAIEYLSDVLRRDQEKSRNFADLLACRAPRGSESLDSCRSVKPRDGSTELTALSFLVHLVGDVHQPLHVGRRGDQGGNRVAVNWFDEVRNLHSVWDSGMIEKEGLSFTELVDFIEAELGGTVDVGESDVRDWASESIAYRHQVYEVYDRTDRDNHLPDLSWGYKHDHISMVKKRLYQGGLRLAALLNSIYD
ncbi:MAG: S1/P1 nuclease [Acidobacteriota bacterium]|nr:S1/P1 nuclease [Acidobacteriota bacterium]